jgi:hypothetical protein
MSSWDEEMFTMMGGFAAFAVLRKIPTTRGGDLWNAMTVMRVMKRLGIAGE